MMAEVVSTRPFQSIHSWYQTLRHPKRVGDCFSPLLVAAYLCTRLVTSRRLQTRTKGFTAFAEPTWNQSSPQLSQQVGLGNFAILAGDSKDAMLFLAKIQRISIIALLRYKSRAISAILCIGDACGCGGTKVSHPTVPSDDAKCLGTEAVGFSVKIAIHEAGSACQWQYHWCINNYPCNWQFRYLEPCSTNFKMKK